LCEKNSAVVRSELLRRGATELQRGCQLEAADHSEFDELPHDELFKANSFHLQLFHLQLFHKGSQLQAVAA
jgi:hypothetical protein